MSVKGVPKRQVTYSFIVGQDQYKKKHKLYFDDFNAIVLAGASGSGKSSSLAWWLSQLAYKGVQILPCEYDAAMGIADSLYQRIEHLEPAFLQPFATTLTDIVHRVRYVEDLIGYRKINPQSYHFPVILIIDEFSSMYIMGNMSMQKLPIDRIINLINTGRKYNVRFILAGQTWSQMSTAGIAQIRESCNTKIIHKLGPRNLGLLLGDGNSEEQKVVGKLRTGFIYWRESILYVPSSMDMDTKKRAHDEAARYAVHFRDTAHLSKEEFIAHLLDIDKGIPRKESVIRSLLENNPKMSSRDIYKQVGGGSAKTYAEIRKIKAEMGLE